MTDFLSILFEFSNSLLNLFTAHFFESQSLLDTVVVSGDGQRRRSFTFADCDTGLTLSDGLVVLGKIFSGSEKEVLKGLGLTAGLA